MVIITTRETHRLATCSEKELGQGVPPLTHFQSMPCVAWTLRGGKKAGEQLASLAAV